METLTLRQAAALRGVRYETIQNCIYDGRLPARRTNGHFGHYVLDREDVLKLKFGRGRKPREPRPDMA